MAELLVVVVVIIGLMGISLPALSNAKRQAQRIQCLNRLRAWGLATQSFAIDHDGYLPPDGAPNGRSRQHGWYVDLPREINAPEYHVSAWRTNALAPLGVSVWHCPANPRRSNGANLFHYVLNRHINGVGAGARVQIDNLQRPGELIWLFDNGGQAAVAQWNNVAQRLHPGGANLSFLDGHVDTDRVRAQPSRHWIPGNP